MSNDTVANSPAGEVLLAFKPTAYTDATPILSSAIDLSGAGVPGLFGGTTTDDYDAAGGALFTASVGHGLAAGDEIKFITAAGDTAFTVGTSYWVHATGLTTVAFSLAATPSGARIAGATADMSASTWRKVSTPSRNRRTIFIIGTSDCSAHGGAFTVTESATSGGSYAAPAAGNTIYSAVLVNSGVQTIQYLRNPAKPFIKVTFTGDNGSAAGTASAVVIFGGHAGQNAS